MSDCAADIQQLLAVALQHASEIAQAKVGRPLTIVEGELPTSNALLRFDVKFDQGAVLSWYVSNEDATGFSDILIGGAGNRGAELTEMHLDALSGAFSDMLERSVDGINTQLSHPLNAGGVDMGMEGGLPDVEPGAVRIVLALEIEGFGRLTVVEQANAVLCEQIGKALTAAPAAAGATPAAPGAPTPTEFGTGPATAGAYDNVVELPNLGGRDQVKPPSDLRMLLNVPLNVTVELGRTERTVRDILDLNVGSILELEKLAGDPMDIMVNGTVLARGEVVVIDEDFGVRITEILSPEQRLRSLG